MICLPEGGTPGSFLALCVRCPRAVGLVTASTRAALDLEVRAHALSAHHWDIYSPGWEEGDDYWVLGSPWARGRARDPMETLRRALWVLLNQTGADNTDQILTETLVSALTTEDVLDVLRAPTKETL